MPTTDSIVKEQNGLKKASSKTSVSNDAVLYHTAFDGVNAQSYRFLAVSCG